MIDGDIEKVKTEMMAWSRKFWLEPKNIKSDYETERYLHILEDLQKVATACTDSNTKVSLLLTLSKAITYLKKVLNRRK